MMKKILNKKNIIAVTILVLLGSGIYYKNLNNTGVNKTAISWEKKYPFTNPELKNRYVDAENFFVDYPEDYTVNEINDAENIKTAVFEKKDSKESFQIFSMPFDEQDISAERITEDDPKIVIKDPQNITIAGVPALLFFSTDPDAGDVRELWFVNKGRLYQVSTFIAYDKLLSKVMKTFTFK